MSRTVARRQPSSTAAPRVQSQRPSVLRLAKASAALAYACLLGIQTALAAAFLLRLVGADQTLWFVTWVLRFSEHFMRPFRGFLDPVQLRTDSSAGKAVVDSAVLLAMCVYGIVALVVRAIDLGLGPGDTAGGPSRWARGRSMPAALTSGRGGSPSRGGRADG
jgi:hypothetical protein